MILNNGKAARVFNTFDKILYEYVLVQFGKNNRDKQNLLWLFFSRVWELKFSTEKSWLDPLPEQRTFFNTAQAVATTNSTLPTA